MQDQDCLLEARQRLEEKKASLRRAEQDVKRAHQTLRHAREQLSEVEDKKECLGHKVDDAAAKLAGLQMAANQEIVEHEREVTQRASAYREHGNFAMRNDDFKKAHDFYTAALGPPEQTSILPPEEAAKIYGNRCAALIAAGKWGQALLDVDVALDLKPDSAKNYFRRAKILRKLGKLSQARMSIRAALKLSPESSEIGDFYAHLMNGGGCPHEVLKQSNHEAIGECELLRQAGNFQLRSGEVMTAISLYSIAIKLAKQIDESQTKAMIDDSQSKLSILARLLANRCQAYLSLGEANLALSDAQVLIQEAPTWTKAHYRLGTVLLERGQKTQAYAAFKRASHLDPADAELNAACQRAREAMLGKPLCKHCGDILPCKNVHCTGRCGDYSTLQASSEEHVACSGGALNSSNDNKSSHTVSRVIPGQILTPHYELGTIDKCGSKSLKLKVCLPQNISSVADLDLRISTDSVHLRAEGIDWSLSLPFPVREEGASASFRKKSRLLLLLLPCVSDK